MWSDISTNQKYAFVLGIAAAAIYWFHLLLLTQKQIHVQTDQLIGLVFAIAIAVLSWFRFVFTVQDSLK